MECPCKTIIRCLPALSLSRSELAVLVNYEQTFKEGEDGVGTIESIHRDEIAIWYKISVSRNILRYIVEKGSIAIDGISLTVAEVTDSSFSVSVIPHTQGETNLIDRKVGDKVNLECDIIGKYVEKLVLGGASADDSKNNTGGETKLTESFLAENGFI